MKKASIILFLIPIFILGSCSHKKQKESYPGTIAGLVHEIYDAMEKEIFFELYQTLNDSIANRTNYFCIQAGVFINEMTKEFGLFFVEMNERPPEVPVGVVLDIYMKNEKTIFLEFLKIEQININDFKKKVRKYILEPDNTRENTSMKKVSIDFLGEIKVPRIGVRLSINAKDRRLSANEWLLFFECLRDIITIYDEMRNNIAIKEMGKSFNSLTFKQRVAIAEKTSYPVTLTFECNQLAGVDFPVDPLARICSAETKQKIKNNKIIQKKLKNEIKRYEKFIHGTDCKSAPAAAVPQSNLSNQN